MPVPRGRVLLPLLEGDGLRVESAEASAGRRPRVGFVCTSHRAGEALERWCRHHLELGADHLLVVLDEVAEPGELEEAHGLAERLSAAPLPGRVTVWSAAEAAGIWPHLAGVQPGYDELVAAAGKGSATDAVAARQTLNATAALQAARAGALGRLQGEPLDWLVHLDSDELFHLEGRSRGGASLTQHFGALDAAAWRVARYANHELLLSAGSGVGGVGGTVRFKLNPRVAAARLGQVGWRRLVEHLGMEQEGPRPYFRAYWNGKSAVAVASGRAAAGVHGWFVEGTGRRSRTAGEGGGRGGILVGPSVLHLHLPTRRAFREKFLAVARSDGNDRERAFPPSPLEERAVGLIRGSLEAGGDAAAAAARLDALHDEADRFEPWQVDLLAEAGLLVSED